MAGITPAEHAERRVRLLERADGLAGVVLFDAAYIRYFTGFNFLATERPVAVVIDAGGALAAFVPEFEIERVPPARTRAELRRADPRPALDYDAATFRRAPPRKTAAAARFPHTL